MTDLLEYKGYVGQVTLDREAGLFHGEVLNTRDVITFQGTTVPKLEKALRDSIEDYLAFCSERGEKPEKPVSGRFVVRIPPDLHRAAIVAAAHENVSLNSWVKERIAQGAA
jgi:predicted HicB family RNase H-like nuclease